MDWCLRASPEDFIGRAFEDYREAVWSLKAHDSHVLCALVDGDGIIVAFVPPKDVPAKAWKLDTSTSYPACSAFYVPWDEEAPPRESEQVRLDAHVTRIRRRELSEALAVHRRTIRRWALAPFDPAKDVDLSTLSEVRWVRLSEAAHRLDVHPRTLHRWRASGKVGQDEMVRLPGGHWRVREETVARLRGSG